MYFNASKSCQMLVGQWGIGETMPNVERQQSVVSSLIAT